MPLILNQEIENQQAKLGVWEINESMDSLFSMVELNDEEQIVFSAIKNKNRAKQWLTSRVILSQISGNNKLSIIYEKNGRPLINDVEYHISISHTSKFVAVILSRFLEAGIDIEEIHPRILKIKPKFVSIEENKFLKDDKNLIENLILIWSAKEALFKMDGKGNMDFRKDILIKPFNIQEDGIISGSIIREETSHNHPLYYKKIQDHILVYLTTSI